MKSVVWEYLRIAFAFLCAIAGLAIILVFGFIMCQILGIWGVIGTIILVVAGFRYCIDED